MSELPWEDNLLERKTESDLKDLLKTLVAFANSVRPGHVATILIGEKDDGTIQGVTSPESIQKTVRDSCDKIYPSILWNSKVYEKDGKYCVRVDIEYDGETPHFGGTAWVRRGSETMKATDEVFQRLLEFRLSKVRELAKWIDKLVTVSADLAEPKTSFTRNLDNLKRHPRWPETTEAKVQSVTGFWVTFETKNRRISEPLGKLTLSWDDEEDRLEILVTP